MDKFYMGDNEIAVSYRTAASKSAQIQVLADLNACSRRKMRGKLITLGVLDASAREQYLAAHPNLGRTKITAAEDAARRKAIADGMSASEMAALFHVTPQAIRCWANARGLRIAVGDKK